MINRSDFEWDSSKDKLNQKKHGVSFSPDQLAFLDHDRVILEDPEHRDDEKLYYCLGRVAVGMMTVRFTYRNNKIRIIGAGYWPRRKKIDERENKIQGRAYLKTEVFFRFSSFTRRAGSERRDGKGNDCFQQGQRRIL